MSALAEAVSEHYRAGEYHAFRSGDYDFAYVVTSGAIYQLTPIAIRLLDATASAVQSRASLVSDLALTDADVSEVEETINDLIDCRMLETPGPRARQMQPMPQDFPLQSLVMNLTNQCNLSCQYCYEYGEDKLATPDGKPKFMEWDTAKQSLDYLFRESGGRSSMQVTAFSPSETMTSFSRTPAWSAGLPGSMVRTSTALVCSRPSCRCRLRGKGTLRACRPR